MNWLDKITASHVRSLTPYESARRLFASSGHQSRVYLNANESPTADCFEIDSSHFNRYPDCQPSELISAYADYAELNPDQVIATRGADEGIELLIRAFCTPAKSKVLICTPTYGMYAISAQTFNVGIVDVELLPDFSLNLADIKQQVGNVNIVFLCSPNNPTGTLLNQSDIHEVLTAYKDSAIVVLDEAYIEFSARHNNANLLKQYSNLVILRTLSKAFGLAGIRCGFMLCSDAIHSVIMKVIAPYPISDPVAQIASTSLSEKGLAHMSARVDELNIELNKLKHALCEIDAVDVVGEQCGNFILFRSSLNQELMQFLVEQNVLIRNQSKQTNLNNCLRISAGTSSENDKVISLIQQFFIKHANSTQQKAN